ncbi:hypothetical protein AGMMS49546_07500 [Spirochaetia bacterium]|nr:hypothetical protein AGMMS49546_07500 [Spirochaetia bacterium]
MTPDYTTGTGYSDPVVYWLATNTNWLTTATASNAYFGDPMRIGVFAEYDYTPQEGEMWEFKHRGNN